MLVWCAAAAAFGAIFSNRIMLFTFFLLIFNNIVQAEQLHFNYHQNHVWFVFPFCKTRIRKLELVDIVPYSHINGHVSLVSAQLPMKFPLVSPNIRKLIDTFYHLWPIYFYAVQCVAYQPILANTLTQTKKNEISLINWIVWLSLINSIKTTCITFGRLSNIANSFQNVHHHHLRIL